MSPTSRVNARHYLWGDANDGWHLLEGEDLSVIEERVPPGGAESRHRHRNARQFFYVLSGVATLEVDGVAHALAAGEGLHVPPGSAHQLRNQGTVDACFLVVSAPRSHGDREDAPA
ncbi:MAG TPA: cupin domain-containing protein [Xanthomonadaceae bacterium]|jgi:mannose-6-phosphate isomerase-like protein (cupin superfamily)|nr:cupin domain-containing protein [Xanthomonadaceae bacterium]